MGNCPPVSTLTRPWESLNAGLLTRTVEVRRIFSNVPGSSSPGAPPPSAIGDIGYIGAEQTTTPGVGVEGEQVLYVGLPATIAPGAAGRGKGPLAADLVFKPGWNISIPASAVPKYGIRDKDIIVDDEAYRYQVTAAGYSAMAWNLQTIRLET